jgi:hypothetical protein
MQALFSLSKREREIHERKIDTNLFLLSLSLSRPVPFWLLKGSLRAP